MSPSALQHSLCSANLALQFPRACFQPRCFGSAQLQGLSCVTPGLHSCPAAFRVLLVHSSLPFLSLHKANTLRDEHADAGMPA